MISAISSATPSHAAAQPQAATQPAQAKPQPAPTDTVQISSEAKQILQESIETPVQTAKEAAGGDLQARRLVAREAAAKAAIK
jgi:hypothetical protein